MAFYQQYCQARVAEQAIRLGARAVIIRHETTLSLHAVRDLCRHINPPTCAKGNLPSNHRHYLHYECNVHASLAALIWAHERSAWHTRLAALVAAYQRYEAARGDSGFHLSFDRFWTLTRVLAAGQLVWVRCGACGAPYLIEAYELTPERCRLCDPPKGHVHPDKLDRARRLRPAIFAWQAAA